MNFLGNDFILLSLLWLVAIFTFMFIFRNKIFSFYYKDTNNMDKFLTTLKSYLKKIYPKVNFNFKYLDKIEDEPNSNTKKYALIDNIVSQYISLPFNPKPTELIKANEIWTSYAFNSKPNKDKLPKDWLQRKDALFKRDNKTCQKCSQILNIKNANIFIIKDINDGGQYYFENLIICCADCAKIENNKRDQSVSIKYLNIKENLYNLVK